MRKLRGRDHVRRIRERFKEGRMMPSVKELSVVFDYLERLEGEEVFDESGVSPQ